MNKFKTHVHCDNCLTSIIQRRHFGCIIQAVVVTATHFPHLFGALLLLAIALDNVFVAAIRLAFSRFIANCEHLAVPIHTSYASSNAQTRVLSLIRLQYCLLVHTIYTPHYNFFVYA